jgi:hypothetical protein
MYAISGHDLTSRSPTALLQVDDTVTTVTNTPFSINVTNNDIPITNKTALVVGGVFREAFDGICVLEANNLVTYTPNKVCSGSDMCMFTVCDIVNDTAHCKDTRIEVVVEFSVSHSP